MARIQAIDLLCSRVWALDLAWLELMVNVSLGEGNAVEAVATGRGERLDGARRVEVREGGIACVPVVGPIFRRANLLSEVSGATSIETLARDLRQAVESPDVRSVLLEIDSPGGEAAGVFECARLIRELGQVKPIRAYVGDLAASAGYCLAAACSRITLFETALVGSIGCVAAIRKDRRSTEVEFVSSNAPLKRADPETSEGRAYYQKLVDDLGMVFARDVAGYRGRSLDQVLSGFGRGGLLMGQAAVDAGMADELGSYEAILTTETRRHGERHGERQEKRVFLVRSSGGEMDMDDGDEAVAVETGAEAGLSAGAAGVSAETAAADAAVAGDMDLRAELESERRRRAEVEEQLRAARAEERERGVKARLSAVRVAEGRWGFTAEAQRALTAAVLGLDLAQGESVLKAVERLEVIEFGERGWPGSELPKDGNEVDPETKRELLAMTPLGRSALRG